MYLTFCFGRYGKGEGKTRRKENETNLCLTKQKHTIKMMDVFVPEVGVETSFWKKGALKVNCQIAFFAARIAVWGSVPF